jgi:hypothetical protein
MAQGFRLPVMVKNDYRQNPGNIPAKQASTASAG